MVKLVSSPLQGLGSQNDLWSSRQVKLLSVGKYPDWHEQIPPMQAVESIKQSLSSKHWSPTIEEWYFVSIIAAVYMIEKKLLKVAYFW